MYLNSFTSCECQARKKVFNNKNEMTGGQLFGP